MTRSFPVFRTGTSAVVVAVVLALLLLTAGCMQPAPRQQNPPSPVTVSRADSSHLLITYPGSTATSSLLELEVTVTDSAGKIQTQSIGDKYSTTPLKFGATLPLTGTFTGKTHVIVTGYFMDGSKTVVLDTTL